MGRRVEPSVAPRDDSTPRLVISGLGCSTVAGREWDPEEWQAYCEELLTVHYGVRVQIVPDRGQGDGGLEAYVADECIAFQCYAPESPFSLDAQTAAQRNKIRTDTKKLIDHPDRTQRLIGAGRTIREWVLLTPSFEDKALVVYANDRSLEVRRLASEQAWCDPLFRVSVHDDSLFAIARAHLLGGRQGGRIAVDSPRVNLDEVRQSGDLDLGIEATLDEKLVADSNLARSPRLFGAYKEEVLRDYFRGGAELARLARDVPSVHKSANECADIVFDGLARSLAEADGRPVVVVGAIQEKLQRVMEGRMPALTLDLIILLSRYFVASWWIQCPLQFDEGNHG